MEKDTSSFTLVKKLKTGGKSQFVYLLENQIGAKLIKKKYSESDPVHLQHFKNEVRILNKLKVCPFVPKIKKLKREKKTIYMNYCGDSLELLKKEDKITKSESFKYRKQIKRLMKELDEKWGVTRVVDGEKTYKVNFNNVCRDENGNLYLIDFGSLYWTISGKK